MRDLPVVLSGYRCTVVDPPCPKTKDDGNGGQVVVVNRNGVTQFVVSVWNVNASPVSKAIGSAGTLLTSSVTAAVVVPITLVAVSV